mgnify:CR=1 FL=1
MLMSRATRWVIVSFCLVFAGCASSGQETESEEAATASEAQSEASSEPERPEKPEKPKKPDYEVVTLDEVIGNDTASGLPQGCPSEWTELKGRKFKGKLYACDGFHVDPKYKEPTVVIGVEEEKIRRVSLQAFYEAGEEVSQAYNDVTNEFQQRCDRQGGGGGTMVLQCSEFIVDISFRRETGMLRMVYGLENWDLPN